MFSETLGRGKSLSILLKGMILSAGVFTAQRVPSHTMFPFKHCVTDMDQGLKYSFQHRRAPANERLRDATESSGEHILRMLSRHIHDYAFMYLKAEPYL